MNRVTTEHSFSESTAQFSVTLHLLRNFRRVCSPRHTQNTHDWSIKTIKAIKNNKCCSPHMIPFFPYTLTYLIVFADHGSLKFCNILNMPFKSMIIVLFLKILLFVFFQTVEKEDKIVEEDVTDAL